jgi:FkbM family methyltransferase
MNVRRYAHSSLRLARALTPRSFVRYAVWRARENPHDTRVRLRNGLVVEVRGGGGDYWTISEIFFNAQYALPPGAPGDVHTVVDTGANVGYAALWFLSEFPGCRVTAFEPLPAHVAQIEKHLNGNGLRDRFDLIVAAAATVDGRAVFRDAGPESRPAEVGEADGVEVALADWFALLPDGVIDVLKMDIEGGEIALLADPRFAAVAARTRVFVLEWHKATSDRGGRDWCAQRMSDAGFTVTDGAQYYGAAGILWGVRSAVQAPGASAAYSAS